MENYHATEEHLGSEIIAWSAAYAVVGTMIIIINALTLYIFIRTKSLRTRKHVMVINLAVADLLFGSTGFPILVVYLLKPTIISYCAQKSLNKFTKTVSLFTLGAIAVERMHAIIWPIRHQVLNNRIYKIALAVIWVLSAVMTTTMIFYDSGLLKMTFSHDLIIPLAITVITIIIVACYVSIWTSFRRRKHRERGTATAQDKALAVTLLLVAGAFLVGWGIPLFYFSISRMEICQNCYHATTTVFRCARLLFGLQSMINPVIYCFRLPVFKASLKAIVQNLKRSEDFGSRHRRLRQRQKSSDVELVDVSRIEV